MCDQLGQGLTIDIFHRQIVHFVRLTGIERGHDIGVHQARRRPDFIVKTRDGNFVLHPFNGKHFDSNKTLHACMLGKKNLPHAAGADQPLDTIRTNHLAMQRVTCRERRTRRLGNRLLHPGVDVGGDAYQRKQVVAQFGVVVAGAFNEFALPGGIEVEGSVEQFLDPLGDGAGAVALCLVTSPMFLKGWHGSCNRLSKDHLLLSV